LLTPAKDNYNNSKLLKSHNKIWWSEICWKCSKFDMFKCELHHTTTRRQWHK